MVASACFSPDFTSRSSPRDWRALFLSSRFSSFLASGEGSVTASVRESTMWRSTASLKRKALTSSSRPSSSHSMLSST